MHSMEKAYKLLDEVIAEQFEKDGGYVQFSFNYQRFALQIMEFILKIGNVTGISPSEESLNLVKKSVLQMYQLQDEIGDMPNYGSNDGALIFPLASCGYRDFRPTLNTVYALIEGRRLYEPGIYDEEILWFLEKDLQEISIHEVKKESKAFRASGLYSLRTQEGFMMIILHNYKVRPGQMDQMHIDLWHKGINVLCDSGTYSYASNSGKKMSLTDAHNTAKVKNKEQMKKQGPFLVYDWAKAKDIKFDNNRFKGTMVSKNRYSHTREIIKDGNEFIVNDKVDGDYEDYNILFHTPCDIRENKNGLDLYHKGILFAKLITRNKYKIEKSYRSLYYLKKEEINKISIKGNLDKEVTTKIILID